MEDLTVQPEVYRFEGWRAVMDLFSGMDRGDLRSVDVWLDERAERLRAGWQSGSTGAAIIVSNWHPDWIGRPADLLNHSPTLADARVAVAREHGFDDWAAVERSGRVEFDLAFERAVDTMLSGRVSELNTLAQNDPELVNQRSRFGHQASLLHYIAANGVETERQVTPLNAPEIVRLLIDAGADRAATMPVYGAEHTTLELLVTSAHPAAAGVSRRVAALLEGGG